MTNPTYNKKKWTQNTASPLVYTNMGWLRDGSHRRQCCQASRACLRYPALLVSLSEKVVNKVHDQFTYCGTVTLNRSRVTSCLACYHLQFLHLSFLAELQPQLNYCKQTDWTTVVSCFTGCECDFSCQIQCIKTIIIRSYWSELYTRKQHMVTFLNHTV